MAARSFDNLLLRDVVTKLDTLLPPDLHDLDLGLSTGLPIALLPVRLEARFSTCLLYTSPSPRDGLLSRMPSSA